MKHSRAGIILLASILTTAGARDPETLVNVGDPVPAFTVTATDHQQISTQSLKGKVTLVNFFATWCGPCMEEMPHLEEMIWQQFKDRGLAVLAIGRGHNSAELVTFKAAKRLTVPIAADPKGEIYAKFATKYIPRNYLIGRDGKVLFSSVGFETSKFNKLIALIDAELRKGG
jgi:peroxiredoxin